MRDRTNEQAPNSNDDLYGHLAEDAGLSDEEFSDITGVDDKGQKATDTAVSSSGPD